MNKRHAKNYIGVQANARFSEVRHAIRDQERNALIVDGYEVDIYRIRKTTTVCSCKQTSSNSKLDGVVSNERYNSDIVVTDAVPLFGTTRKIEQDDEFEYGEDEDVIAGTTMPNMMLSVDCALCYRTGFVPGYERYGHIRLVLTEFNISNVHGYTIEKDVYPHKLQALSDKSWIEFEVEIPEHTAIYYSLRNNDQIVKSPIYDSNNAILENLSPGKHNIRVIGQTFTHLVVEVELNIKPFLANISQFSRTIAWEQFDTLSNVNVFVDPSIKLGQNDLIYVKNQKLMLAVVDTPYLKHNSGVELESQLGTRVVQPQENLKKLNFKTFLG